MGGNQQDLRRRLEEAVEQLDREPSVVDARALVARGLRQRLLHRASLTAAGVAAAIALVVVAAQTVPGAVRIPDGGFATDPSGAPPSPGMGSPRPGAEPVPGVGPTGGATPGLPGGPVDPAALCEAASRLEAPAGVEVELTIDRTVLGRDEQLRMTIEVRNGGARSVAYERSGQRYDFWIEGPDGTVWLWSHSRAFIEPLIREELAPGARDSASATWDRSTPCASPGGTRLPGSAGVGRPPPGSYEARALWKTIDGGWWSDPVAFVIV